MVSRETAVFFFFVSMFFVRRTKNEISITTRLLIRGWSQCLCPPVKSGVGVGVVISVGVAVGVGVAVAVGVAVGVGVAVAVAVGAGVVGGQRGWRWNGRGCRWGREQPGTPGQRRHAVRVIQPDAATADRQRQHGRDQPDRPARRAPGQRRAA